MLDDMLAVDQPVYLTVCPPSYGLRTPINLPQPHVGRRCGTFAPLGQCSPDMASAGASSAAEARAGHKPSSSDAHLKQSAGSRPTKAARVEVKQPAKVKAAHR